MLATLILLYALDTGQIPTGCYVAAWVFTILYLCGDKSNDRNGQLKLQYNDNITL